MFNFIGFLFSLLKGIYNTCAIHTQVNQQASVARILFAGFFGILSSSINKILLDEQIKEYNTKLSTNTITNPPNLRPSHIQRPIQHIVTQHSPIDDTYEQILEQPHTSSFQSQNSLFFSP